MPEGPSFNSPEKPYEQSTQQESLRTEIDSVLDEYFLLLSKRGLEDREKLGENIKEKRELLVQLTQRLNGQLELDNAFSETLTELFARADRRVELGHQELVSREDGKDNVEAILADMNEYSSQVRRMEEVLDSISQKPTADSQDKQELEIAILEVRTMVKAVMSVGGEIQRIILSLNSNNKSEHLHRFTQIMNDVVKVIKNFDETTSSLVHVNKIKENFYQHFDEALHFYEELRDISNEENN